MRYVIAILVVLSLASRALNMCFTPDQGLEVRSDCDLPNSSDTYDVRDCDSLDWRVSFRRTEHNSNRTIIEFTIEGTNMSESYPSWEYLEGSYSDSGSAMVTDTSYPYENKLKITKSTTFPGCSLFADMELRAYNYR